MIQVINISIVAGTVRQELLAASSFCFCKQVEGYGEDLICSSTTSGSGFGASHDKFDEQFDSF